MLGTWFYEHPYLTDSNILLYPFFLTNVLIVSLWIKDKCLLIALKVMYDYGASVKQILIKNIYFITLF